MFHAPADPPGGSDDHHEASNQHRRRTFSGSFRREHRKSNDPVTPNETMKFPWSTPSAPSSPTFPNGSGTPAPPPLSRTHRRTISGSIFRGLGFLRSNSDGARPSSREKDNELQPPKSPRSAKSRKSIDDDPPMESPTSPKGEGAMGFVLRPVKVRKRKGSLRKTAIMGGKRILTEGGERKGSFSAKSPLGKPPFQQPLANSSDLSLDDLPLAIEETTPSQDLDSTPSLRRQFSYEDAVPPSSDDSSWTEPAVVATARLQLVTEQQGDQHTLVLSTQGLTSPLDMKSSVSQASYTSTTDDDDVLTFDRPANGFLAPHSVSKPLSPSSTSYFPTPSEVSLSHRGASKSRCSPLSHTISSASSYPPPTPPPHDYTETEYWGWVILVLTWVTFTVGMGSCLDIWSWAWDVGETPYAPPELEDDPTLPIVGYYPALIVLTGVVAWVWVVVAWVGMKYFRHAKIEV